MSRVTRSLAVALLTLASGPLAQSEAVAMGPALGARAAETMDESEVVLPYARVAVVARNGTNNHRDAFYNNPATALNSSALWCGTPSPTNPCLVKIMPGVYSVAGGLPMKPLIDVEGSGRGVTRITRAGGETVSGAGAQLRHLTIENTGGGGLDTYGILTPTGAAAPSLQDVAIILSGAISCSAFCHVTGIDSGGVLALRNVKIDVQTSLSCASGCEVHGVSFHSNAGGGRRFIRDTDINVTSAVDGAGTIRMRGMRISGSGAGHILERVRLAVAGSAAFLEGISVLNSGSAFELRDSVVAAARTAGGGTTTGLSFGLIAPASVVSNSDIAATGASQTVGILVTAENGELSVSHSRIAAATNTVRVEITPLPIRVKIGGSSLSGGAVENANCAGVFDEDNAFYENTCP